VRLRRRAGHVVHARPGKDSGSQWQLVTAANCPFMHFPRAAKVEMQTWSTYIAKYLLLTKHSQTTCFLGP
jgi:hypothetical protein